MNIKETRMLFKFTKNKLQKASALEGAMLMLFYLSIIVCIHFIISFKYWDYKITSAGYSPISFFLDPDQQKGSELISNCHSKNDNDFRQCVISKGRLIDMPVQVISLVGIIMNSKQTPTDAERDIARDAIYRAADFLHKNDERFELRRKYAEQMSTTVAGLFYSNYFNFITHENRFWFSILQNELLLVDSNQNKRKLNQILLFGDKSTQNQLPQSTVDIKPVSPVNIIEKKPIPQVNAELKPALGAAISTNTNTIKVEKK